jgi:hypothetical protein
MTKEEKENLAHNNYPYGSEMPIGSRDRSLYENKKESFLNGLKAAINYSQCCTELCDCEIPKPIDAYHPEDKNICRDCKCKIA